MKQIVITIAAGFILFFAFTCAEFGLHGTVRNQVMAEEYGQVQSLPDPYSMLPGKPHTWGTDPDGVIYEGYYPPPDCRYRRSWDHRHLPYYCPYLVYPYYYEPARPWYEKDAPIAAGRLQIMVEPVQARAFINGYPLGRHPDLTYEIGLLEGEHHLEVKADGFVTHERTINIQGGQRLRLTIRLDRD